MDLLNYLYSYFYSPNENAGVLAKEPGTSEYVKKFQKTVVGDGLKEIIKVLRTMEGVEKYKDPFDYWDIHFNFDVTPCCIENGTPDSTGNALFSR